MIVATIMMMYNVSRLSFVVLTSFRTIQSNDSSMLVPESSIYKKRSTECPWGSVIVIDDSYFTVLLARSTGFRRSMGSPAIASVTTLSQDQRERTTTRFGATRTPKQFVGVEPSNPPLP